MNKRYSLGFMLTLVFAASALSCLLLSLFFYLFTVSNRNDNPGLFHQLTNQNRNESTSTGDFAELIGLIDNRFIGNFDIGEITDAAMRAAVESLDDNWSYYMSPEEYAHFLADSDNTYYGIGVEVNVEEDTNGMIILGVYKDSGAYQAGIVIGDIVVAIDGESIRGLTIEEIRTKLRRELGETAVLTVLRADGEYHELTVTYGTVFRDPVTYEMLENNIGYIWLRNFEEGASERFIAAVNELIDEGAKAFIYDVRNNNGGRVSEVTEILDFLLPEGEIFISVDRSGVEKIIRSDAEFVDIPAVVLVNRHSYSGAEFFAAMLSEYDYAPSVGEQTTGKNRMQTTIPLSNGGAAHISTGHYLTKNRVSLFETDGFTPEYLISLEDDDILFFTRGESEEYSDPQLEKALSLFN